MDEKAEMLQLIQLAQQGMLTTNEVRERLGLSDEPLMLSTKSGYVPLAASDSSPSVLQLILNARSDLLKNGCAPGDIVMGVAAYQNLLKQQRPGDYQLHSMGGDVELFGCRVYVDKNLQPQQIIITKKPLYGESKLNAALVDMHKQQQAMMALQVEMASMSIPKTFTIPANAYLGTDGWPEPKEKPEPKPEPKSELYPLNSKRIIKVKT